MTDSSRRERGRTQEERARRYLEDQGLHLRERNFLTRGGELDLIMDHGDTLVFVEVRFRADARHGGALASIGRGKQRRIIRAALAYLQQRRVDRPCRFDVVALDDNGLEWIRDAFQAD